jgi:hypothetical protein
LIPDPLVSLNPLQGAGPSNYNTLTNIINNGGLLGTPLSVYGRRGTALALKTALDQLDNSNGFCRPWANKCVVLITDGSPTNDLSGAFNPPSALADALAQGSRAHAMGVTVFIVAVCMSTTDPGLCKSAYGETSSGVCQNAGFGSKYYEVDYTDATTTTRDCIKALGNIARQLDNVLK